MGDAAILEGEIVALRAVLGNDLVVDVADQAVEGARRCYPGLAFHFGLHSSHPEHPRWRRNGIVESLRRRRTSLAVRLMRRAPALARLLLNAEQRAHVERMRAADVVLATGGTYLVEHYNPIRKADEVLLALALGKPVFLGTQSMGPFRRPALQRTMRAIAAGAAGVFLRDERSRGHLAAIGADLSRAHVHADTAFALADPRPTRPGPAPGEGLRGRRIAISVRRWSHFGRTDGVDVEAAYRRAVADAARAFARAGAEVVFLSTCQGVPEYWADDSRYAQRLVDDLLPGEPGVTVDTRFRRPSEVLEAMQGFDVVIATRMHAAILALCAATPVVAIAYEFKSRELLRGMGREAWAFDYEQVTAGGLATAVREAIAGGEPLRAGIAGQVLAFREDALGPSRYIAAALGRRDRSAP